MSSSQPSDFTMDLAARIALHEILLEKLFLASLKSSPNPEASLEALRQSLVGSFEVSALTAGSDTLSQGQQELVRQQSLYGKELSDKFASKIAKLL